MKLDIFDVRRVIKNNDGFYGEFDVHKNLF